MEWEAVRERFRQIWGYDDFRPPQGEVVSYLLSRRDCLVVLATGGGKSVCFQLPALLQRGLTVVVSPLVALMEDQVQDIQQRGLAAAALHSHLDRGRRSQILRELSRLALLYVSPETLLSPGLWQKLSAPDLPINGVMIDEAHCLVQWGDTFRPDYRRLGAVRLALQQAKPADHPPIPVAAFTATANPETQRELIACLQLRSPAILSSSVYRPNLFLRVAVAWTAAGRRQQGLKFIRAFPDTTGIVYVRTRRDTEEVADWLQEQGLRAIAYHAGLTSGQRRDIERAWLGGAMPIVVCTSAFGMGINQPHVRWVLHLQAPLTLAEYIQEVGRAGRDRAPAQALMLVSEPTGILDPGDRQRVDFFIGQQEQQYQRAAQLGRQLPRRGRIDALKQRDPDLSMVLGLLHRAGCLRWTTPFEFVLTASPDKLPQFDRRPYGEMTAYQHTKNCRWQVLRQAFGEAEPIPRCGHCDRCCP
jgi:ATP-dependent DNA helicase RecQ